MNTDQKMTIDEAKANAWTSDVNAEIEIAESIMRDLARDCYHSNPGENDTILNGINGVIESAEKMWEEVYSVFGKVKNSLEKTMSIIKEAVDKAQEVVNEAADAFKN